MLEAQLRNHELPEVDKLKEEAEEIEFENPEFFNHSIDDEDLPPLVNELGEQIVEDEGDLSYEEESEENDDDYDFGFEFDEERMQV